MWVAHRTHVPLNPITMDALLKPDVTRVPDDTIAVLDQLRDLSLVELKSEAKGINLDAIQMGRKFPKDVIVRYKGFCRFEDRGNRAPSTYYLLEPFTDHSFASLKAYQIETKRKIEEERELAPKIVELKEENRELAHKNESLKDEKDKLGKENTELKKIVAHRAVTVADANGRSRTLQADKDRLQVDLTDCKGKENRKNRWWGLGGIFIGVIFTVIGTKIANRLYPDQLQYDGNPNSQNNSNGNIGNPIPKASLPLQFIDSVPVPHNANVEKSQDTIKQKGKDTENIVPKQK